jgi:hypothetical protein
MSENWEALDRMNMSHIFLKEVIYFRHVTENSYEIGVRKSVDNNRSM